VQNGRKKWRAHNQLNVRDMCAHVLQEDEVGFSHVAVIFTRGHKRGRVERGAGGSNKIKEKPNRTESKQHPDEEGRWQGRKGGIIGLTHDLEDHRTKI